MSRILIMLAPLWLLVAILGSVPTAHAQDEPPLTTQPTTLDITSTLPNGAFAASIRLVANSPISNVQIYVTDLADATGDGQPRDSLPAKTVRCYRGPPSTSCQPTR
jgi:hypothetical protein